MRDQKIPSNIMVTSNQAPRRADTPSSYEHSASSNGSQGPGQSEKNSLSEPTAPEEILEPAPDEYEGRPTGAAPSEAGVREDSNTPRDMKPWQWLLLSGSVLFSTLLLALDNTVVADLQPQIVETFSDISKLSWVNVNFSLGAAGSAFLW